MVMNNEYNYELVDVEGRLSEDEIEVLREELSLLKDVLVSKLKEIGEFNEPIAVKWVDRKAVYKTINFKLVDDKVEVRLANKY